jgi:hypothetical protein
VLLSLAPLKKLSTEDLCWVLAAAMPVATMPERQVLAAELLERAAPRDSKAGAGEWLLGLRGRRARVEGAALGALAQCFATLPEQAREVALVVGTGRWKACVPAQVAQDERSQVQASLAMLAACAADAELLPWIERAFGSAKPAAARALLMLAERVSGGEGASATALTFGGGLGERRREQHALAMGVARLAMRAAEGQSPAGEVSQALLLALDGPRFAALSRGTWSDELVHELQRTMRTSPHALARARALAWCNVRVLSRACIARLARATSLAEHEAVLCRWHLAMRPARAGALAQVPVRLAGAHGPVSLLRAGLASARATLALPTPAQLRQLPTGARTGACVLAAKMHVQARVREALLEPLLLDESVHVRHVLARSAPQGLLPELAWDSDTRVARSATLLLLAAEDARAEIGSKEKRAAPTATIATLDALERSPHAAVRALVLARQSGAGQQRRLDARAMMLDRGALVASLRAGLVRALETGARSEAPALREEQEQAVLGVLARLRSPTLSSACAAELAALSGHAPAGARARATTLMVLSHVGDARARGAIVARLHDAEDRVRANAVEALALWTRRFGAGHDAQSEARGARGDGAGDGLGEVLGIAGERCDKRTHHRERANAAMLSAIVGAVSVHGLGVQAAMVEAKPSGMREGEGPFSLAMATTLSMLRDERVMQRAAGLWLSWRLASRVQPKASVTIERRVLPELMHEHRALLLAAIEETGEHDDEPTLRARSRSLAAWLRGPAEVHT